MAGPIPPLQTSKRRLTNEGIPLISEWIGGESDTIREIPPEWRAALDLVVTEQPVPTDRDLFQLTDEILACKAEQKATADRTMRTIRKPAGVFTLFERYTDKDKEFGTRTKSFHFDTDFGSVPAPTATRQVSTKNFGNKHFEEVIEEIPGVFTKRVYSRDRGIVTPEDFRAGLQTLGFAETTEGVAADPGPLPDGYVSVTDSQEDVFLHRLDAKYLPLDLPKFFINFETNQDKQIVQVSRFLLDDSTTPAVPTSTRDTSFTKLGDGTALEIVKDVDEIFPAQVYGQERGIVTPEDFRALLQVSNDSVTSEGIASDPGALADGQVSITDTQVDVFNHRVDTKEIDVLSLPLTIHNYKTNQYKQIVDVFRKLCDDGTTPAVPTALREVAFTKLGDGTALEVKEEVDEVFDHATFKQERGVVTPEDFRALLQVSEFAETIPGSAADPGALSAGQLSITDEQVDVFSHRITTQEIDLVSLPLTVHNYETNQFKQNVDVFRTLELDSTSPASITALQDVIWTKLGDGTALQIRKVVGSVFDHKSVSTEIPDFLPDIFKAALPSYTHETESSGTSVTDPPVLAAGDFFKSETRETEFTKKIVTRGRAGLSLPQSVVVLRKTTEEYGGEIVKLTGYLDSSEPAVEEGLDVVNSEVRNLGNSTWFRQTEKLDTALIWPALIGTEVDPRTGIAVGITKQVVDAGIEGGVAMDGSYVDVKSIDKWRSLSISSKLTAESLPAPETWETTIEHRFPNTLLAVAWIWQAAVAPFAYDFDMALVLDMIEGYAGPCRAKITESFSVGAPTDVVTPTIFSPQGHMLGYTWGFAADPSEDCGTCIGIARANAKTWTIPPSLHDEIDLTGSVTLDEGSFTNTLPATCPIGLPTAGTLITKACEVERWRFGVFYRKLTEIYVPDLTCV